MLRERITDLTFRCLYTAGTHSNRPVSQRIPSSLQEPFVTDQHVSLLIQRERTETEVVKVTVHSNPPSQTTTLHC